MQITMSWPVFCQPVYRVFTDVSQFYYARPRFADKKFIVGNDADIVALFVHEPSSYHANCH